jgi:hypothetical protein
MAFSEVGIEVEFNGEGLYEKGYIKGVNHEIYSAAVNIEHLISA